jgi:hypothetical protein
MGGAGGRIAVLEREKCEGVIAGRVAVAGSDARRGAGVGGETPAEPRAGEAKSSQEQGLCRNAAVNLM